MSDLRWSISILELFIVLNLTEILTRQLRHSRSTLDQIVSFFINLDTKLQNQRKFQGFKERLNFQVLNPDFNLFQNLAFCDYCLSDFSVSSFSFNFQLQVEFDWQLRLTRFVLTNFLSAELWNLSATRNLTL